MGIFDSLKRLISGKEFGEFSWKQIFDVKPDDVQDIHYILEKDDITEGEKPYIVLWIDSNTEYFRTAGTKEEIIKNFGIKEKDFIVDRGIKLWVVGK